MKESTTEGVGYESGPEPVLATSSKRKRCVSPPEPFLKNAEDAGVTKKACTDRKDGIKHQTAAHSSSINYFAANSDNDEDVDKAAFSSITTNSIQAIHGRVTEVINMRANNARAQKRWLLRSMEQYWARPLALVIPRSMRPREHVEEWSRPKLRGLHRLARLTSGNVHEAERVLLRVVAKRQALSRAELMWKTFTNGDVAAAVAEVERRIRGGEVGKDYIELDDGTKILRPKSGGLCMASQTPADTEGSEADETKEEEEEEAYEEDMEDRDDDYDDDGDEWEEFNGFSDIDEEEE
ncbi:hypothetical protein LTR04_006027 [Oleoguttula sp. CCFEE 6159]|nr:hypothetical protein LTR04_006027 [Oleoguttula sp. CCFEE 6159]